MTRAVEAGTPKLMIEEAAARRQVRADSGEEPIVGVNRYRREEEEVVETLDIDTAAVRAAQLVRLGELKTRRDDNACRRALEGLAAAADSGGELLEAAVEAARRRATVGEISETLAQVFTRYRAEVRCVSGVYGSGLAGQEGFDGLRREVEAFAGEEGRRPRLLVVKLGQDGHDRGAKVVATAFADLGFDVDIGPLFQEPEEAARQAVENDVHAVGVSSLTAAHKTLVPRLIRALKEEGGKDILVLCGGIIPPRDQPFLRREGVSAFFGPGTNIPEAAAEILELIRQVRRSGDGPGRRSPC
jgi:methylmalonyl-CoA mutase